MAIAKSAPAPTIRHEPMRIAGRKVDAEGVIEVHYPYSGEVMGTVPAGGAAHAREAFDIAAAYQPKLTRYERQQILLRTAELLVARKDEISDLITLELGISKADSLYEVGRAYDVLHSLARCASRTMARYSPATSPRTARRARSSPPASR
jgi:acyl-CoA reductase-like NAD-dependent aldehyde dehydrogenase